MRLNVRHTGAAADAYNRALIADEATITEDAGECDYTLSVDMRVGLPAGTLALLMRALQVTGTDAVRLILRREFAAAGEYARWLLAENVRGAAAPLDAAALMALHASVTLEHSLLNNIRVAMTVGGGTMHDIPQGLMTMCHVDGGHWIDTVGDGGPFACDEIYATPYVMGGDIAMECAVAVLMPQHTPFGIRGRRAITLYNQLRNMRTIADKGVVWVEYDPRHVSKAVAKINPNAIVFVPDASALPTVSGSLHGRRSVFWDQNGDPPSDAFSWDNDNFVIALPSFACERKWRSRVPTCTCVPLAVPNIWTACGGKTNACAYKNNMTSDEDGGIIAFTWALSDYARTIVKYAGLHLREIPYVPSPREMCELLADARVLICYPPPDSPFTQMTGDEMHDTQRKLPWVFDTLVSEALAHGCSVAGDMTLACLSYAHRVPSYCDPAPDGVVASPVGLCLYAGNIMRIVHRLSTLCAARHERRISRAFTDGNDFVHDLCFLNDMLAHDNGQNHASG